MEKRIPRQRAASPTIYSELIKWILTIWCFHESVLICFRCFQQIRSCTVILVLGKFMFFDNHICGVNCFPFLILIIAGADTTADHNSRSLVKIFLCKLCTLSKYNTGDKICFLLSVTFILLFTASVYLATAMSLSFPAYLISGFFVSLPIKITLFIIVIVLSAATLPLHILLSLSPILLLMRYLLLPQFLLIIQ